MPVMHDCHAHTVFPFVVVPVPTWRACLATGSPPCSSGAAPARSRSASTGLARKRRSRDRCWCSAWAGPVGPGTEGSCRGLSEDHGLVVLAVACLTGAQDGTTVLAWAAEHAAELG